MWVLPVARQRVVPTSGQKPSIEGTDHRVSLWQPNDLRVSSD